MEEDGAECCNQTSQKEETKARIATTDAKYRDGIRRKLDTCIDPLNTNEYRNEIVSINSGKIGIPSVNVHEAVSIGEALLAKFEKGLPGEFYTAIPKQVKTVVVTATPVAVGGSRVTDLDAIYVRVKALLTNDRGIDMRDR